MGSPMDFILKLGAIASLVLPLFNIPLIVRIVKRKSSDDLSLIWVVGVWGCIVLMFPMTLVSPDPVFKLFGISNIILFTVVMIVAVKYHKH